MMENIYIVEGSSGSHDDYMDWIVAIYDDKGDAQEHVQLANKKAAEIKASGKSWRDVSSGTFEHDPNAWCRRPASLKYRYYTQKLACSIEEWKLEQKRK